MNLFSNRKIVTTSDGSHSVFLPEFNEHYHSVHGAVQESKHVFLKMGWDVVAQKQNEISILEVGFGTGLNAFLVLCECEKDATENVCYDSLEKFPLEHEIVAQLNYPLLVGKEELREKFFALHEARWNETFSVRENFSLKKISASLEESKLPQEKYDLVFFDAFAPRVQPELWTENIFRKIFAAMKPGGILVTYCSKGDVRRNMSAAGFSVEKLQGPPGKREMLRAEKRQPSADGQ